MFRNVETVTHVPPKPGHVRVVVPTHLVVLVLVVGTVCAHAACLLCLPARTSDSFARAALTRFALNSISDCTLLSAWSSSFAVLAAALSIIAFAIDSTLHDAIQFTDFPVSRAHDPTVREAGGVSRIPPSFFVTFMH